MGNIINKFRNLKQRNNFISINYSKFYTLNTIEKKILSLTADGLKQYEISGRLLISLYDVENHWENLKSKLNVKSDNDIFRLFKKNKK